MILPSKIEIQITNAAGKPNPLGNVLFGLKIFTSDGSYHNYSPFKSDMAGHIVLTKQDIIANTELKWEKNLQSKIPTRFELYVWQGEQDIDLIEDIRESLKLFEDDKFVEENLKRHGFVGERLKHALSVARKQAAEDKEFYLSIKGAINHLIKVHPEKIKGIWLDNSPKSYQFVIQTQTAFKLRP
jgi:G3E family GTPase